MSAEREALREILAWAESRLTTNDPGPAKWLRDLCRAGLSTGAAEPQLSDGWVRLKHAGDIPPTRAVWCCTTLMHEVGADTRAMYHNAATGRRCCGGPGCLAAWGVFRVLPIDGDRAVAEAYDGIAKVLGEFAAELARTSRPWKGELSERGLAVRNGADALRDVLRLDARAKGG